MVLVKLFNAISPIAMKELEKYELKEHKEGEKNPEVIIARSAKLHNETSILDSKIVARAGVGTANIPTDKLTEHLIPVVYAPGGNADSVAELTISKLLDAARRSYESTIFVKNFEGKPQELEKIKKNYKGFQLCGKSICILGMGNIGTRIAYILSEFGMKVYIKIRSTSKDYVLNKLNTLNGNGAKRMIEMLNSNDKRLCICENGKYCQDPQNGSICITNNDYPLYQSDFISCHIGSQKTPFFNEKYFEKVKKGAILINTDRGNVVCEKSLLKALEDKTIACYQTDFAPECLNLRKHPKCISSPHTAATTKAAEDNCAMMVVDSICNFIFDGNMKNSKNFPTLIAERKSNYRLVVFGKIDSFDNDKIIKILKNNNISIIQNKSASNNKIIYSIFDINNNNDKIIKEIESIKNLKCFILNKNDKFESNKNQTIIKDIEEKQEPFNFSAGPAVLPQSVKDGLVQEVKDSTHGLSICEISHRDPKVVTIIEEIVTLIRKLLKVPENYYIFLPQGGATLQFTMIPMNLSKKGDKIGYLEQGMWSKKAIADAFECEKIGYGTPIIVSSNIKNGSRRNPVLDKIPQDLKWLHVTDNETVHGLQFKTIPDSGKVPLILDSSSSVFSQKIDWNKNIGMIYGGAQKQSGIAGMSFVILRKDMLDWNLSLPSYLGYKNHIVKKSEMNTPPVTAMCGMNLMLKWLDSIGGVDVIEKENIEKSDLIYNTIEKSNGFYIPRVELKEERSIMNVVFNLKSEELENKFIKGATEKNMIFLKGHRSLKGVRASIYNAMPKRGVIRLVEYMKQFQKDNQ